MRILKSQSILRLLNSYLVDSPQPANLSYFWNFGSLLGTCLIIQILTGVFLAMHYTPHVDFAFNSVEHIMRDVNAGYILRYTHANVASFFFMFVYAHIARGLFYSSYRTPRILVWNIGVIIFILMMATAFLGYVLPYGQMSLWGATVITNLLSAIPIFGKDLVESNIATNLLTTATIAASECVRASGCHRAQAASESSNQQLVKLLPVLTTIGTVRPQALKKKNGCSGSASEPERRSAALSVPYPFIAFLVGLIDGDGYIQITKTTRGYITNLIVI